MNLSRIFRFFGPLLLALALAASEPGTTERLQVAGEWCFIKHPAHNTHPREAVILLHGNGQTVEAESSSWERREGTTFLMETLLRAGYRIAQSNHTGIPGNGMWGNDGTQRTVMALMEHLGRVHDVRTFHAIATSAGNVTLLNLQLDAKALFQSAVLIVPVISLESMYHCPAGVDRVAGIAAAFRFQPETPCPGDPEADSTFRKATASFDPLRKVRSMDESQLRAAVSRTRWLALYDKGDPKVLPTENVMPFQQALGELDVEVRTYSQRAGTHNAKELLRAHSADIVTFLEGKNDQEGKP